MSRAGHDIDIARRVYSWSPTCADGTRIPLMVVSRYTKPGFISHEYSDHVSILKFIERNWDLKPVSHRSRDNFPNPVHERDNPYVPRNSPAISDLFDLFDFHDTWNH